MLLVGAAAAGAAGAPARLAAPSAPVLVGRLRGAGVLAGLAAIGAVTLRTWAMETARRALGLF